MIILQAVIIIPNHLLHNMATEIAEEIQVPHLLQIIAQSLKVIILYHLPTLPHPVMVAILLLHAHLLQVLLTLLKVMLLLLIIVLLQAIVAVAVLHQGAAAVLQAAVPLLQVVVLLPLLQVVVVTVAKKTLPLQTIKFYIS